MKLAVLSLLLPVLASAASFEDEVYDDEDYVNLPDLPQVELWDLVRPEADSVDVEIIAPEASPFAWSILSYLGSFLSPVSLLKNVTPPPIGAEVESFSEAELDTMATILNCDRSNLRTIDASIKKRILAMRNISASEILSHLAEIGNKSLFEMFVDANMPFILTEATSSRDLHAIIFNCIKIDSIYSFANIMLETKFSLNGPQAIVVASMNGSHEILQFMIDQKDNSDYAWEWRSFDGGNGFMFDFGKDPLSAALFLGALKAISGSHLECLRILVANGVDISFKDYILLKDAVSVQGTKTFEILFNDSLVPNSTMNEVLLLAINNSNVSLVEYLLSLNYTYQIMIQSHLVFAINSNNQRLFDVIFERVNPEQLNSQVLSLAASVGNAEIFISLLKASRNELIVSALCSCIANENLQHYVPIIASSIKLNSDIVAQALLHSVKARSLSLVKLILNEESCSPSIASPSFIEALMIDNVEMSIEFLGKFQPSALISQNILSKTLSKLFEIMAWKSLKLFVECYFSSPGFPKAKFISQLILTNQVEIAKIAAEKGANFPKSELIYVRDEEMRAFVMQMIAGDINKSQIKKSK